MKKLITLTFVITALLLGAIAINAHPGSKQHNKKHKKGIAHKPVKNKNNYDDYDNYGNNNPSYYPIGYRNGYYNRRGVYIYFKNKNVWKYGRLFKNTYKIKVFQNGRKKVKLMKSVPIHRHYGKRVTYKTKIVHKGFRTYRVTYKITRFPNGKVKRKVVKRQRIYSSYNW